MLAPEFSMIKYTYPCMRFAFSSKFVNYICSVKMLLRFEKVARSKKRWATGGCRFSFSRGNFLWDNRALLAHDLTRAGEIGEAGESIQVLQRTVSHDIQRVREHLPLCLRSKCTAARWKKNSLQSHEPTFTGLRFIQTWSTAANCHRPSA